MFSVIDLQYTHVSIIFNINNYKSCPRQKDVFYHIKCFSCKDIYFRNLVHSFGTILSPLSFHVQHTPLSHRKNNRTFYKIQRGRRSYIKRCSIEIITQISSQTSSISCGTPRGSSTWQWGTFKKKCLLFSVYFLILGKVFMYSLGELVQGNSRYSR